MEKSKKITKRLDKLKTLCDNHDWEISNLKESVDYLRDNNHINFILKFPSRYQILTLCLVILTFTAVYYFIFK